MFLSGCGGLFFIVVIYMASLHRDMVGRPHIVVDVPTRLSVTEVRDYLYALDRYLGEDIVCHTQVPQEELEDCIDRIQCILETHYPDSKEWKRSRQRVGG